MKLNKSWFVGVAAFAAFGPAAASQDAPRVLQGKSLFGEPLYTTGPNPVNVAPTDKLLRAVAEAKTAYESNLTIDSATWYGRLLGYQGLMREAIEVYTAGLKKYPNSAKLLRHRAHRYFNLREFDRSIEDGLKSAALYENRPLEREKLGPDYFPSTPDVVQFYLYYHLGHAYLAKHDYKQAAHWFDRSRQVGVGVDDKSSITAATYWQYLSLARGAQFDAAAALLERYTMDLVDLKDNLESDNYFEGLQLFKHRRDPAAFFDDKDSGKAFSTSDGIKSSTSYSLANYYIIQGRTAEAKDHLRRAMQIDTWSFFARVQAEADWILLYGEEKP
jgi:tetratricopeptide (TPR) repeat protein